jgi:hypothetical protein
MDKKSYKMHSNDKCTILVKYNKINCYNRTTMHAARNGATLRMGRCPWQKKFNGQGPISKKNKKFNHKKLFLP